MDYQKAYPETIDELPQIQMQLSEEDFDGDHENDICEHQDDGNINQQEEIDIEKHNKQSAISKQNQVP